MCTAICNTLDFLLEIPQSISNRKLEQLMAICVAYHSHGNDKGEAGCCQEDSLASIVEPFIFVKSNHVTNPRLMRDSLIRWMVP